MALAGDFCNNKGMIKARFTLALITMMINSPLHAEGSSVPPAWRTPTQKNVTDQHLKSNAADYSDQETNRTSRPWYHPRAALGVGLNVPEILPFEGYLFFGKYVGVRLFLAPDLPLNIRIEMPSDVVSSKKGIGVATPDFTIRMRAHYGPHYGAELLAFPFGGSFFLGVGASYRRLHLTGSAKSPILICSLIEAAKDPPCGNPDAAIKTETQLGLKADATTSAILMRSSFGWFWHVGSGAYLMFNAGLTKPTSIHTSVRVEASVDSPGSDDDVSGALKEVKAEKEADLEAKARKEMQPVVEKVLPILGIGTGIRF